MSTPNTCSVTTLAKLFGITERWIQQLAQEGVLVRGRKRGEYELVGSVRGYVSHLQARLTQRMEREDSTLQSERKRLLKFQANKAEYEFKLLEEKWVSQGDVSALMDNLTDRFIQGISSLPGRLAVELIHQADPAVVRHKIKIECDALRNELSKQFQQWGKTYEDAKRSGKSDFTPERSLEDAFESDAE